ncbi:MAG: hypothetical protein JWO03_3434 [Bacteroidetes bacterium]|nr:hypothetical protein [Bacteroidota bacterium]
MINPDLMRDENKFLKGNPLIHRLVAMSFVIVTMAGIAYLVICIAVVIVRMIIHWLT